MGSGYVDTVSTFEVQIVIAVGTSIPGEAVRWTMIHAGRDGTEGGIVMSVIHGHDHGAKRKVVLVSRSCTHQ